MLRPVAGSSECAAACARTNCRWLVIKFYWEKEKGWRCEEAQMQVEKSLGPNRGAKAKVTAASKEPPRWYTSTTCGDAKRRSFDCDSSLYAPMVLALYLR